MKLKQLLSAIEYTAESVPELEICDIVYDSRKAVPGCLFVCLRGASADGHRYAAMAAEKAPRRFSPRSRWRPRRRSS